MAKLNFNGCKEIIDKLSDIGQRAPKMAAAALFEGAKVTADMLREAVQALPEEQFHPLPGAHNNGDSASPLNVLTPDDKADLLDTIFVKKFEHSTDGVTTEISFAGGYSRHPSKKYPRGIPLPIIARSIESGSSARRKRPFVRTTASKAKEPAAAAMQAKLDEYINNMNK